MCKYLSKDDDGYKKVTRELQDIYERIQKAEKIGLEGRERQ